MDRNIDERYMSRSSILAQGPQKNHESCKQTIWFEMSQEAQTPPTYKQLCGFLCGGFGNLPKEIQTVFLLRKVEIDFFSNSVGTSCDRSWRHSTNMTFLLAPLVWGTCCICVGTIFLVLGIVTTTQTAGVDAEEDFESIGSCTIQQAALGKIACISDYAVISVCCYFPT